MTCFRLPFTLAACLMMTSCASHVLGAPDPTAYPTLTKAQKERAAYSNFLIARFAAMTNDPVVAADRYAAAIETAPENSGIAERAVFSSLLAGDYKRSVSLAKVAQARGSEATLIKLTLGVDALKRGDDETASLLLNETGFGPFNRMVARGLSAWQVSDAESSEVALEYLRNALTGDPNLDSATLYLMGLLQVANEEDAAALATFDALWLEGARLAVGVEAYAELLAAKGDRDRAIEVLSSFRANVGQNASLERLRARIEQGKTIRPRRLTTRQGAALAIYVPAAALMSQTDDDLAGVYFVLALALDPDLHVARSLWAQSLDNAGRRMEAIEILEEVPKSSDFYATARAQMAWAYRREDQNEKALDVAADALAHAPDRDLKIQLSDLYRSMERYQEAERILTELITADKTRGHEDWRLLYARGAARERLGKWPEARADLEAALAHEPEDASLLNYLGYAYVDRGENLDAAFEMIRKAVALQPNSGFIVDSLGWAHYRLGQYDEAVRYLERAVELLPSDPVLNDHLGDAYYQAGRRLEARYQWQRSLKLEPEAAEQVKIENKLAGAPPNSEILRAEIDDVDTERLTERP